MSEKNCNIVGSITLEGKCRLREQAYPLRMLNSRAATYIDGAVLTVDGRHMAARLTGRVRWQQERGNRLVQLRSFGRVARPTTSGSRSLNDADYVASQ